jgi:hypothetical protein
MKYQLQRIRIAMSTALLVWRDPTHFSADALKMSSDITGLIFKVGKEQKPMMTKLCLVHVDGEQHEVVSIWAGAGIGSSPTKRIEELLEENRILKRELFLTSKKP